jgi:hypothetical protein
MNARLSCDSHTNIVIIRSDFGLDKYSDSCGEYFNVNCTSLANTTEITKNLCENKQICDLGASIEIFPDPCNDKHKLLRVWYQCVGDGIVIMSTLKIKIKMCN